ncbi:MAG: hypothetical protein LBG58_14655 [Planctomycetaceae bacterium]|jgi:hypothetical protein|nr:hypothetical protein [Planctomycetaceae bacterium]
MNEQIKNQVKEWYFFADKDIAAASKLLPSEDLTKPFWNAVEKSQIRIIVSNLLEYEWADAPEHVRVFLRSYRNPQKHVVNIDRIRGYNAINQLFGYPQIEIRNPGEVLYENES